MSKKFLTHLFLFFSIVFTPSCTYNISMAHTEGQADDVIRDTLTPQNTVSPDIQIPLVGK